MKKVSILSHLIIEKVKSCPEASDEVFNDFMQKANQHTFEVTVLDTDSNTQWTEESSFFSCAGTFQAYLSHEIVSHFIFQFDDESIGVYVTRSEDDYTGSDKFYLLNTETFQSEAP